MSPLRILSTKDAARLASSVRLGPYEMRPPPLEGILRFYQGNGKPTLYMDDLWANFYAVLTKQP